MRLLIPLVLFVLVAAATTSAQPASQRLDAVANELDSIVTDLEAAQTRTQALESEVADLRVLAADHAASLEAQRTALEAYRHAVAGLEAHDKASLAIAEDLRTQLDRERWVSVILWPAAGISVAVAVVEGVVLWLK